MANRSETRDTPAADEVGRRARREHLRREKPEWADKTDLPPAEESREFFARLEREGKRASTLL